MSKFETLCEEYRENKRMIEELEAINEDLKNNIIDIMGDQDTKIEGSSKATYKTVESQRLDSAALKKEHIELYQKYLRNTSYKRFIVCQYGGIKNVCVSLYIDIPFRITCGINEIK